RQHPRERRRHFPGLVREALAHLERRRAVTHAQNGDAHRLLTQRNRWVPGAASLSATYTSSTAVKLAMLANAARRPAQWRTTRTPTAHPKTTQVSIPHTTWAASTDAPPAYCTPNPSSTPSVTVGNPSTSDRWFNWSSRSSGGDNRKTGPKRFALSSWNCSRYRAAAMDASGRMATPKTLNVVGSSHTGTPRAAGRRPEPCERGQRERGGQCVKAQSDQMRNENHGTESAGGAQRGRRPPIRTASSG